MAFEMIDSVRNYSYILMYAAYDSFGIYNYIFENTHAMPVIDINEEWLLRKYVNMQVY